LIWKFARIKFFTAKELKGFSQVNATKALKGFSQVNAAKPLAKRNITLALAMIN